MSQTFLSLVRNYKTSTAVAGEVEALIFRSKDGNIEYTIMRDSKGRAWINRVSIVDADINIHGVSSTALDAGDLVMPLWEYKDQIPAEFQGEQHTDQNHKDYHSTEKYLEQNKYLNEFKQTYKQQNEVS